MFASYKKRHAAPEGRCMSAAIHQEVVFEDEICTHLKKHGWLCDGPLPYVKGHAYWTPGTSST
jgi:hypothetical protein